MLTPIILTLALYGQAPDAAPPSADVRQSRYADLVAKNRVRRDARYRAGMAKERAQAQIAARQQAEAARAFQAALPFLLEQERQRLQRLSALEQIAALQRIAAGNERIAAAIQLDMIARQNARLGYHTPVLLPGTPGVPYGPYGAMMYGAIPR